jgi:hypothetical protein
MPGPDFSARLNMALERQGLSNADFAAKLGHTGQQKINRWRARGQVGGPTLRLVRAILSKTSMEWLNEGTGSPEPFPPPGGIGPEVAHPARLDDRTVTDARAILDYLLGGAGIEFDACGDVELFLIAYRCLSDPSPANRELLDQAVGNRVASTGGKNGSETPGSHGAISKGSRRRA